jgi:hypothetical protein
MDRLHITTGGTAYNRTLGRVGLAAAVLLATVIVGAGSAAAGPVDASPATGGSFDSGTPTMDGTGDSPFVGSESTTIPGDFGPVTVAEESTAGADSVVHSTVVEVTDADVAILDTGIDEIDDLDLRSIVPDHTIAKYLREDVRDRGWLVDMREGFEGRVRNQLAERFRGGYDPEGIARFAETYVREAHIYWQVIEDDPETYQEKVAFVQEKVEQYREKWETSTFDPDEEWLSSFGGVEDGEQLQEDILALERRIEEALSAG